MVVWKTKGKAFDIASDVFFIWYQQIPFLFDILPSVWMSIQIELASIPRGQIL